jgi:osmotically-inducible protein OsmY
MKPKPSDSHASPPEPDERTSDRPQADASERLSREAPRKLAHTPRTGDGMASSDEQIRSDLQARLAREDDLQAIRLLVCIGDGVVTLKGEVATRGAQERLVDIVRSVPSVREVKQELYVRSGGLAN